MIKILDTIIEKEKKLDVIPVDQFSFWKKRKKVIQKKQDRFHRLVWELTLLASVLCFNCKIFNIKFPFTEQEDMNYRFSISFFRNDWNLTRKSVEFSSNHYQLFVFDVKDKKVDESYLYDYDCQEFIQAYK